MRADADRVAERQPSRAGLLYGFGAYSIWGFFPLYFQLVSQVPPWVVLCHRIFWSVLFLGLVVSVRREWTSIWSILRNRRKMVLLSGGGILIALNWLIFIYSVASRQVLESSLGYFINPMLSVALGGDLSPRTPAKLAMAGSSDRRGGGGKPGVSRSQLSVGGDLAGMHFRLLRLGAQEG